MTENARELSRVFKILSVDTRVRIIQLLKGRSLCVNAMARGLNITPAAVSQHLRILRDAGIVNDEKRGYYVHYSLNHEELKRWKQLTEEFLEASCDL